MKTKKIYQILGLLLFINGLISCGESSSEKEEGHHQEQEHHQEEKKITLTDRQFEALQMKIDTLQKRAMSGYVEANGHLEVPPQNEAAITSVIGANVVSIEVIEGDRVEKGETMAYLSHPEIIRLQTEYQKAHSDNLYLKKEFERQKKLYEAGVGSGMNFQKAETAYRVSKSQVKGLETQLQMLSINPQSIRNGNIYERVPLRSPIEGFVQKVNIKTGQYVEAKTELIEIVNTHHVHADLMVYEKDVTKVKTGQTVLFNLQTRPEETLSATIYSVGKTFEEKPKAVHVHAEIKNKQGDLIPGMYIQGKILVDNTKTIALPESAIATEGETSYVFRAEQKEKAWQFFPVKVITGKQDGEWTAIRFLEEQPQNAWFVYNNAYYLVAEMKKGEGGGHHH